MTELGEKCSQCGHTHQGPQFGYICIGCPCQELHREPHDAGLKRIETEEAKKQQCVAILEQIVETAFEMPEPFFENTSPGGHIYCTVCGASNNHGRNLVHKSTCTYQRIQGLKKELENVPKEGS